MTTPRVLFWHRRDLRLADNLGLAAAVEISPAVTGQYRSGDVRHIVADPAKAAQRLGFRAAVDPGTGLREFADAPLRG